MSELPPSEPTVASASAPSPGVLISKLTPAPITEPWPTEPHHFTPWLLANAEALSSVIGLELELEKREYQVGTFFLDLYGKVAGSDEQVVIVENQYGATDHKHLGQILTYAGGTNPAVIVWIAESFRDEHRAALDWLNQSTHPDIRFFGVRLGAVRMKGAPSHLVAPHFELVCKPNDWEKLARAAVAANGGGGGSGGSLGVLYKQFWERFEVEAKARAWTNGTAPAQNWWSMPTGIAAVKWGVSFSQFGARSELVFENSDVEVNLHRFNVLRERAGGIQEAFGGGELHFDPLPDKISCRVECRLEDPLVKVSNTDCWDQVLAWMVDTQERLRKAVLSTGGIPNSVP